MSVIIPAHNEESYLGACLSALLCSAPVLFRDGQPVPVQVVVAANGCTDRTCAVARGFGSRMTRRGWKLVILDIAQGSKIGALNAADARASGDVRIYLDADVNVGPDLLRQTWEALQGPLPRYASGRMDIIEPACFASRAYREIYRRVPFQTRTIPGAGYFAVNAAGRARWEIFPDVIADDLFVRLQFDKNERIQLSDSFRWELTEGFRALVRVRRRQDTGTRDLLARFPRLVANEDKPRFEPGELRRLALRFPVGMAVYCAVALMSRLPARSEAWARGRS
ncbi:glycosyltransferase [Salipiger sp. IMCC34102]|nr:glycosyltransferase [Salipiger sp. IMCC34102]